MPYCYIASLNSTNNIYSIVDTGEMSISPMFV